MAIQLHQVLLFTQPQYLILLCQLTCKCNVLLQRRLHILQALLYVIMIAVGGENGEEHLPSTTPTATRLSWACWAERKP